MVSEVSDKSRRTCWQADCCCLKVPNQLARNTCIWPDPCRPRAGGAEGAAAVAASGGIGALVSGLGNADPQAACFASAGVSALARLGGGAAKELTKQAGLLHALLAMASAPQRQGELRAAASPQALDISCQPNPGVVRCFQAPAFALPQQWMSLML